MQTPTDLDRNLLLDGSGPWCAAASRAIHPSSGDVDRPLVEVIAAGLAAVTPPWDQADTATERQYERLLETEHYDVWLIHWPAGTGLDAHDHGGSVGAFAVVSGRLDEDIGQAGSVVTRRFGPGDSLSFDADHVHAVVNRGDVAATSVHVYWPPLRSMRFHADADTGGQTQAA